MLNHPLAELIQEQNKKYQENAELMFLNLNDLENLSEWASLSGHRLLKDADEKPKNYWGLSIIIVDDNDFKATFFKETDIRSAMDNNWDSIKKTKYKADVKISEVPPYTEYFEEDGYENVKVPQAVKKAYQQYLDRQ